jgi:outer membrane protein insertion porin family
VSSRNRPHPDTHQMDVIVHIEPGPRARVASVQLNNQTEYRDAEILSRLKIKDGQTLTTARILRGTDRIRKFLVKKGRLSARATVRRGDYDAAKNSVPLELEVTEGPRVEVAVAGANFSKGDLKRLVPVYQENAVDVDLLEEGKRNIRERLDRQGYFDAEVSYSTQIREVEGKDQKSKGTEQLITYRVERGSRHKLVDIVFAGNRYFSTSLLRSRLQIYRAAFGSRGRFSRSLIQSDADSMRGLYEANGFLDAKVNAQIQDDYKGRVGDIFVKFDVEEGRQTRVASLAIEGIHAFTQDELLGVIGSSPGQPYSDFNVATDRDNILALYFNAGYPDASFTSTADRVTDTEKTDAAAERNGNGNGKAKPSKKEEEKEKLEVTQAPPVRLVYRIAEGPQTIVQRVLLSGYKRTRVGVIQREIRVKTDAPLRESDVVESQRRLYNLGIFNRVTIEPQNPDGSDPEKDIVVLVEEANRYTMAYGGGFEVQRLASTTNPTGGEVQAAPRGIFEVAKLNLTGRADSLSLKVRASTIEDRALLGYSIPDTFGNSHYSTQATAYTEKSQDINTFTATRYEGSMQLTDQVTPRTTIVYSYAFRKVNVSNLNEHIAPEEIPLYQQPTLVSEFGIAWLRDARDNPADATKGSLNNASFSVASTSIGSSASFMRFYFQNSTYYPIKRRFSFARSIRLGILEPFAGTQSISFPPPTPNQCTEPASPGPEPEIIPLPERFFAGGGTSLRGFALNQAGPRDPCTGFPVGGQAMLVLNQEFRFPMHLPFVGSQLGGAIFYDGGNVYSRLDHFTLRAYSPKPVFVAEDPSLPPNETTNPTTCIYNCTNELNYFAHTVGFGLRYATPVGPIRIDLGYQINRPFFVVPCVPATGTTPTGPPCFKGTQLPRLQIFFNLGSTF